MFNDILEFRNILVKLLQNIGKLYLYLGGKLKNCMF